MRFARGIHGSAPLGACVALCCCRRRRSVWLSCGRLRRMSWNRTPRPTWTMPQRDEAEQPVRTPITTSDQDVEPATTKVRERRRRYSCSGPCDSPHDSPRVAPIRAWQRVIQQGGDSSPSSPTNSVNPALTTERMWDMALNARTPEQIDDALELLNVNLRTGGLGPESVSSSLSVSLKL